MANSHGPQKLEYRSPEEARRPFATRRELLALAFCLAAGAVLVAMLYSFPQQG